MARRTLQDWLLWWDQGRGRRALRWVALGLGLSLFVFTLLYKQFHGPRDETTFAQLSVARSLAEGRGFTTHVLHPQAAAWLASQGAERVSGPDGRRALPEVYQAPGYPLVAGAALRVLPASWRAALFGAAPPPPQAVKADLYLLALNAGAMLLVVAGAAWWGTRYFEARVGGWAAWAVLACAPAWAGVVGLTGVPFSMGFCLAVFALAVQAQTGGRWPAGWACLTGVAAGAWGLLDYPAVVVGPVVAAWLSLARSGGRSWRSGVLVLAGWAVVLAPWVGRNIHVTGLPFGLAGQDLFLRVGDATAEPSVWRSLYAAEWPRIDWNKANHKLALHAKALATGDLWATGGLLAAFLLVSLGFRYQSPEKRAARVLVCLLVIFGCWAEGWWDAGEAQRSVLVACWPVLALWGASFLHIWSESQPRWREHPAVVTAGFVVLQALPLVHDLAEPAGLRFSYPPYYPALLQTLGRETERRPGYHWMSDVPAGSAWYSGTPVWAMPRDAADFRRLTADAPVLALLLTPTTLDRPFFTDLTRREADSPYPFWPWSDVFSGLHTGRFPPTFPLQRVERYAPNLVVLIEGGPKP